MANLTGNIKDVTNQAPSTVVSITVKAPRVRLGTGNDLIVSSPAEVGFNHDTGALTLTGMTGGLSWLVIEGAGWSDTVALSVAGGMTTLVEAVANAVGVPGMVDYVKLLAALSGAVDDVAQDAVDAALSEHLAHINEQLKLGTGREYLIAGDADRMDDLEPGWYTVVSYAAQYLGLPTDARGVLHRVWLTPTGTAKLDFYEWDLDGELYRAWRKFFAGSWSEWEMGGASGSGYIGSLDDFSAAHVITSPDGNVLQEFRRDGTVHIPGLVGAGMGTGYQFIDGTLRPSETDMRRMVGWGSSTLNWLDYEFRQIAATIGAEYVNEGKGGEIGDATVARVGSRPAMVTFPNNTIPATAGVEVEVTVSNVVAHGNPQPFNVLVEGIEGVLEMRNATWYFTPVRNAPEVTVDGPVAAVSVNGEKYRGDFAIFNLGKNSFNRTDIPDLVDYVYTLAVEAFDYLAPVSKRALVIGHFVNAPDGPGSERQNTVLETNSRLAAHFGKLYVDMQGLIESPRLWQLSGLTPTSADLQAQADRTLPPSVQMDGQHLNDAGLKAVGALVREKMYELGWV